MQGNISSILIDLRDGNNDAGVTVEACDAPNSMGAIYPEIGSGMLSIPDVASRAV
jgi:hypothetical protein